MQKLCVLFCFFITLQLSAQNLRKLEAADYNADSLRKIYGLNKKFIPILELQSLIALSHYPELINTTITFRMADKESIAKTTFTFFSVFKKKNKHFIIYLNNKKENTGFTLEEAPFNAQIGAIAHELAHVADFKKKNFFETAWWAIQYLNKKNRIRLERQTDALTVKHTLGWQLYDFVDFIMNGSFANEQYKTFKYTYYLHLNEIQKLIEYTH